MVIPAGPRPKAGSKGHSKTKREPHPFTRVCPLGDSQVNSMEGTTCRHSKENGCKVGTRKSRVNLQFKRFK
jgi:hypothetical protein